MRIMAVDAEHFAHAREMAAIRREMISSIDIGKLAAMESAPNFQRYGSAALIGVSGVLTYGYGIETFLFDGTSYAGIINKLNAAVADDEITSIVLAVNSPGGEVVGAPETAAAVFEARKKKEVIAVVDPTAASAGYWIASQASSIVSLGSGEVGSIGAMLEWVSDAEALAAEGIDYELIRSKVSPNKNMGSFHEAKSEEARANRQSRVDIFGEMFLSDVSRGRNTSPEQVLESYGQGKMLFAPQALAAGMIDAVGSLESVLSSLVGAKKNSSPKRQTMYSIDRSRRGI